MQSLKDLYYWKGLFSVLLNTIINEKLKMINE